MTIKTKYELEKRILTLYMPTQTLTVIHARCPITTIHISSESSQCGESNALAFEQFVSQYIFVCFILICPFNLKFFRIFEVKQNYKNFVENYDTN